jgi:hypothetical protein
VDVNSLVCPEEANQACNADTGRCEIVPGCGDCAADLLCDAARGICVEDCRPFGVCADPTRQCDGSSGLCR